MFVQRYTLIIFTMVRHMFVVAVGTVLCTDNVTMVKHMFVSAVCTVL